MMHLSKDDPRLRRLLDSQPAIRGPWDPVGGAVRRCDRLVGLKSGTSKVRFRCHKPRSTLGHVRRPRLRHGRRHMVVVVVVGMHVGVRGHRRRRGLPSMYARTDLGCGPRERKRPNGRSAGIP